MAIYVVIKNSGNIFNRERISGVRNEQASFADSTITNSHNLEWSDSACARRHVRISACRHGGCEGGCCRRCRCRRRRGGGRRCCCCCCCGGFHGWSRRGRGSRSLVVSRVISDRAVPLRSAGDKVDKVYTAGVGVLALLPVRRKLRVALTLGVLWCWFACRSGWLGFNWAFLHRAVPLRRTGDHVHVIDTATAGILALFPVFGERVVLFLFCCCRGSLFLGLSGFL